MEFGETRPLVSPAVAMALQRVTQARFPGARPVRTSASMWGASCDGLPIAGPIPGRPRELVIAGLGECPLSWAAGLVVQVVGGMLGGPVCLPASLRSDRFR